MRKITLIIAMVLFVTCAKAQSKADIFNAEEIVWCGLDYSNVKLIGYEGFDDVNRVKDHFFNAWNNLMMNESKKYNFRKFYQKNSQINDLSVVRDRNTLPKVNELVSQRQHSISDSDLAQIVKKYNLQEAEDGLGLVYIVESLSKVHDNASIHVVFFDVASKKILWSKRYNTRPGGAGFRNYWASPIMKTIEESGKDYKKGL